jgi:paraquat-inducible protein B
VSEQASKTAIGGFVIGALALLVIGVMIFGSGKFMQKTNKYILYFDGSVKGLNVGSSVAFSGVKVGSVVDVTLRMDPKTMTAQIPVVIEVEPDQIEIVDGEDRGDETRNVQRLIERGMRAQLISESLVTGKLMIELGYHPDTPVRLVGTDTGYPEIPTIPSATSEMTKKVLKLPIEDLFTKLLEAVDAIRKVAEDPNITQAVHSLKLGLDDTRRLINGLNAQIPSLESLLSEMTATVKNFDDLAKDINEHVDPLGTDLSEAVQAVTSALTQAESTIKSIDENMAAKDSPMQREVQSALRELTAAARAIRVWADYLERHPEALIRGKGGR